MATYRALPQRYHATQLFHEPSYVDASVCFSFHQLPLVLTALLHIDLIRHVPLSGHHDVALFE